MCFECKQLHEPIRCAEVTRLTVAERDDDIVLVESGTPGVPLAARSGPSEPDSVFWRAAHMLWTSATIATARVEVLSKRLGLRAFYVGV
jgi:hypothetical protein